MPIYCYKCDHCGAEREHFARSYESVTCVRCPRCTLDMRRDFHAEAPIMATDDGYRQNFTRTYDIGAGRIFETQGEYKQWQKENTKDGVIPEPLSKQYIEESKHRATRGLTREEKSPMTAKEHHIAWMKSYHAAKKEQQAENRIVVK